MKKIAIVLPALSGTGGINVLYEYGGRLALKGHTVTFYAPVTAYNMHRYGFFGDLLRQIYATAKTLKWVFVDKRAVVLSKQKNVNIKAVLKIKDRYLDDSDIVIASAWCTAFDVARLSKEKGEKYYFIQDYEIWDNPELGKKSYKLPLNKIVISTWINEQLKRDLNIGPFPVVCNGIDTGVFHPVPVKKESSKISFLMLNHTLSKKGVANGLEVFEKVKKQHPNCVLRMFGLCDASNLPGYVEYHQAPSKDELVRIYSQSDIFIFPSLEEGWGLTPLEAMACGCAVVGTRTGFVLDLGRHGENMMISAPGDINGMTKNILELIDNPKKLEHIKKSGFETVGRLNWEESTDELEKELLIK